MLVLLYARQNSQTRTSLNYLQKGWNTCEQNGESVVAKLKVVHQHKTRLEELYRKAVNDSKKNADGLKENLRRCELNHLSVKDRLTACEQGGVNTVVHNGNTVDGKGGEEQARAGREGRQVPAPIGGELQRLEELQRRTAELEKVLNETRVQLDAERKEKEQLQTRVDECEQQLVAHVGAVPKPGYSANETAHFERVHDKDANLEFHRDGEAFAPPAIIPARELVRRLEEKRRGRDGREQEEEKHPQDRDDNDEYVAEKPNAAEEDYKEQERGQAL